MQDFNQNEERNSSIGDARDDHQEINQVPQTDREGTYKKEKDFAEQENAHFEEGTNDLPSVEEQGTADALKKQKPENAQSSVSYVPPYYVPNFTIANDSQEQSEPSNVSPAKKRKDGKGFGWIIALCAVITLIVGGIAVASVWKQVKGNGSDNSLSGTAIVEKNTADIRIEETLTSDIEYYTEVSSVAKAVADTVVEITTSKTQVYGQYVTSGAGSGVIWTQTETTGIIVTNFHVVEGADEVTVRLTNGKEYQASYRGGDSTVDIAVLYISLNSGEKLSCVTLGDSNSLVVGQRVVAIGNPLGRLGGTVTDGIISAKDRKISVDGVQMTLLQTNAAINPGNSGGGLFDMAGRLVAIVNAKQFAQGIEGLGFAIPINLVEDAIASIAEYGYVKNRASLGIETTYIAGGFFSYSGLYVERVNQSSAFQVSDYIVSINGTAIETQSQYTAVLNELTIGENATVVVIRNNRKQTLTVPIIENTSNY